MARRHYTSGTWLIIAAFAAGLLAAKTETVQAGSRTGAAVGGAAVGVLLGLAIAGSANQEQGASGGGGKTYRACSSIYGPGAVNAASNPGRCVCRSGYGWTSEGGSKHCVPRGTNTAHEGNSRSVASKTQSSGDLEKIQESLNLLGYDAGSVDGSLGPKTQQAIFKYQTDKQFPATGVLSVPEQQILFKDVEAKRAPVVTLPPPKPMVVEPVDETIRSTNKPDLKPDPKMELALWDTVKDSKDVAELEEYISRYPEGQFIKVALARMANIIKTKEAEKKEQEKPKLSKAEPLDGDKNITTGALPPIDETDFPKARQARADAVAVIIGNRNYRNAPPVDYAVRDAEAMKAMVMRTLGVDSANIIFKTDASRAEMDAIFGTEKDLKGRLWRTLDPEGHSDLYVFYSGHGMPGVNIDGNFLLPVDGHPDDANLSGYPLAQLYKNLEQLKTRSTTVFIDACFSGMTPNGNNTPLIKEASPVFVVKETPSDASKMNVFRAATESQVSSWDKEAGHGIFTRYVLAGLAGAADADNNKEVTTKELFDYVSKNVRKVARRNHGREQDVQFNGDDKLVLSSY